MSVVPFESRHPSVRRVGGPGAVIELMPAYIELAGRIANTEFVPTALRRRPEAVLAALMSGAERGLGPMESLRSIHIIEGRPSLSAEAMRALVLAAGHEYEIVENTAVKATISGRRAGTETWTTFTWTLDRARRARLANKQNWQTYPEDMLLARATSAMCRAIFADVVAGLAATEELQDELEAEPALTRRSAPRSRRAAPAPSPTPELITVPAPATDPVATTVAPADLGGIPGADQPSWGGGASEPAQPADPAIARRIHAELAQAFPDAKGATRDRWRHALVAVVTRRRTDGPQTSSTGISLEEQLALSKLIANIAAGQAQVADGPDGTVELHAGGGWRYTVTLDPLTVTVGRGDQDTGEPTPPESDIVSPASGEADALLQPAEASPDQPAQPNLEETPDAH